MREMSVRLRFTRPCLGNTKQRRTVILDGKRKKRTYFRFQRSPSGGEVIFMPNWWTAVLSQAAEVQCRLTKEVREIRFALEVDGRPQPIEENPFRRYYAKKKYSVHEQFAAGDIVGVSCLVPFAIDDDDLWALLSTAGQYYGISPFGPGEHGFFQVVSITPRTYVAAETNQNDTKELTTREHRDIHAETK